MSGRHKKAADAAAAEARRKAWNGRIAYRLPHPEARVEYEPIAPRSLDFEQRDNVDWSGYYPDGGHAPDYE